MTFLVDGQEVVKCLFCKKGRGQRRNYRGKLVDCEYCSGKGYYSPYLERVFIVQNVRIRTTLFSGEALRDVFDPPHEMDIRAKVIERYHAKLSELQEGDSFAWDYQGYQFKTVVVERRDPPNAEVPLSEATY